MTINVNIDAYSLAATQQFNRNLSSFADSITKLSSGLRVNKTADDPGAVFIGDYLSSQAQGLGAAVKNANDAVSILQIVDGSLSQAIDLINSIRTKAVQAASDSLSSTERDTLQGDVNTLLRELDLVMKTSTYNDHALLNGSFTSKLFQVGETSGQTMAVNLPDSRNNHTGHLYAGRLSLTTQGGEVSLTLNNAATGKTLSIRGLTMAYNNTPANGLAAVADAINKYSDNTNISARTVVESSSANSIAAGSTPSTFAINGINIGAVSVKANDSDERLITAVNAKTTRSGVTASVDSSGRLTLAVNDGRPIQVSGLDTLLPGEDLSTFGYVQIYQQGAQVLSMSDLSQGMAVSFSNNLKMAADVTTSMDSTLSFGSVVGSGSTLTAGWQAGMDISGTAINGNITTSADSTLLAGSVLASGSVIASASTLGGTAYNSKSVNTTTGSFLQDNSILQSGTILASGTYLTNDISTASGSISAGTILSAAETLNASVTLTHDMLAASGSVIASGSKLTAGSSMGGQFTLSGAMTATVDMTLRSASTIVDQDAVTNIAAGSTVGGSVTTAADLTVHRNMLIKSGSVLKQTTELATGSTLGGKTTLSGDHTTTAALYLAAGSALASNSIIKSGAYLTNVILTTSGLIASGQTTGQDLQTVGTNSITNAMTVPAASVLAGGSILAANSNSEAGMQLASSTTYRLNDINVLSSGGAETAIAIVDAALAELNQGRSEAGSTRNQFESAAIVQGGVRANLLEARSKLLDLDFGAEAMIFSKMKILMQASSFALTQANGVPAQVLPILQGNSTHSANQFFVSASTSAAFNH